MVEGFMSAFSDLLQELEHLDHVSRQSGLDVVWRWRPALGEHAWSCALNGERTPVFRGQSGEQVLRMLVQYLGKRANMPASDG